ncbi:MAG: NosD domain-containing protein [Candidatus Heimdallarchaeota archaeon]
MKPHPIVRVFDIILILSALVFLAPWRGDETTAKGLDSPFQIHQISDAEAPHNPQNAIALPTQQYVEHEPISIKNNSDFAALGFPGEGTEENPYVIEYLNITSVTHTLIRIQDTTAYFRIRYNLLNNLPSEPHGIYLYHVTHGMIESNIITNCRFGVALYDSGHCTVAHNSISQCVAGITLSHSRNSTVAYNTVSQCEWAGIVLYDSEQNTVAHNTVSECRVGITLESINNDPLDSGQNTVAHNTVSECEEGITLAYSDQNIISNNTVSNCRKGIYLKAAKQNTLVGNQLVNNDLVIELYLPERGNAYSTPFIWPVEHYLQATVAENVVNGRPLVFWQNMRGGTVPLGAGQIFLLNSTGVEVTGQALARVPTGVFAAFCSHLAIHHNTVSECEAGIALYESGHSTVAHNTISQCGTEGIALYESGHSTVAHNSISQCGTGIKLDAADQNTLADNTVSQCGEGIALTSSSGQNTLVGNQLVDNRDNSLVITNLYWSHRHGISVRSIEHYVQATVAENVVNGRPLVFWQNVRGGTVPLGAGQIFLLNCTGVEVTGQVLARVPTGVFAAGCSYLAIHHNTFSNNRQYGIHVHVSGDSTIANNTISECGVGIRLFGSENITIAHNTVTQNSGGIRLQGAFSPHWSKKNTVVYNTFANNTGYGIGLSLLCSDNTVKWNDFLGNHPGGGQAGDAGSNNVFARNYWDDHDNTDRNGDGIADAPYPIEGDASNQDLSPLTVLVDLSHSLSTPIIAYPYGGETLQGTVTIQWAAAIDTWEHSITYTVSYTVDDGYTWILLASGLSTSEYEWDTTTVTDGSAYRIQVVATCSDGLTAEDRSDVPFTIQNLEATTTTPTTVTSTSLPPVGAFTTPEGPMGILLATLLLATILVRRVKRKAR